MRDIIADGLGNEDEATPEDALIRNTAGGPRKANPFRNTNVRVTAMGKMRATAALNKEGDYQEWKLFDDAFGSLRGSMVDKDDIDIGFGIEMGGDQENDMDFGSDEDAAEDDVAFKIKKQGGVGDALQRQLDTGIIAGTEYRGVKQLDEIPVRLVHKEEEQAEREDMKRELKAEMVEY